MNKTSTRPRLKRTHPYLRYLVRTLVGVILLSLLLLVAGVFSFVFFPPFGGSSVAKIVLIGTDDPETPGAPCRSDTIMLCAARLNGAGTTLLSIPRDTRVHLPNHRGYDKINAAYATKARQDMLIQTLAQPELLNETIPYYLVVNSTATQAVIDALGGVDVNVPHDMNYDDNWDKLHIHLHAGLQHLSGKQVVGYLRWRKNNHGYHGSGTDFERTERQRALLSGLAGELHSWHGIQRIPAMWQAFHRYAITNLSPRQLLLLVWAGRQTNSQSLPGTMGTKRGVSFVFGDWEKGRAIWQQATE